MKRKALPIDPTQTRRMIVAFEVKAAKADDSGAYAGTVEGYAAGIHNVDRAGDMICPGAFTDTIAEFLADGAVCWQHDWMMPIGKPLEAREDTYGLFTKCRISKTQQGLDAMTLIRDGVVNKLSIGYRVKDYQWVDRAGLQAYLSGCGLPDGKCQSILREYDEADLDELFLIKKLKLYEYSPVTVPANPNASITAAKGLPFAEHSQAVLAAVREFSERVKSIHALRSEQGKKANPAHVETCQQLAAECMRQADDLRRMADEMGTAKADTQTLYNRFLQIEAGLARAA